ncbi:MAG: hypothetical protein V2A34_09780 [Lentisphaerota bacterium]
MKKNETTQAGPLLTQPMTGQVLTIIFALCFYFQCMILPIVGPAAMKGSGSPGAGAADHAHLNFIAFLAMLLVTIGMGSLAMYSKTLRRKVDGSPRPYFTMALLSISVIMLIALLLGLFQL